MEGVDFGFSGVSKALCPLRLLGGSGELDTIDFELYPLSTARVSILWFSLTVNAAMASVGGCSVNAACDCGGGVMTMLAAFCWML